MRPKRKRRLHQIPHRPPVRPDLRLPGVRRPMKLVEHRLRIERVHLARRAIHKEKHAMLRTAKMRSLRSQRMHPRVTAARRFIRASIVRKEPIPRQEINQSESSKTSADFPQKLPPSLAARSHVWNEAIKHLSPCL